MLGKNLSVVDFALAAPLHYAAPSRFPLAEFGNVKRWYGQLESLDAWKKSAPPPFD